MKKLGSKLGTKLGILALCAALASLTAAPALARGVGVDVDGKTYTFSQSGDGVARYEIDGKTFLVGEDEVIVREPGKPERRFALGEAASADAGATEDAQGGTAECVSEVTVFGDSEGTYSIVEGGAIAQDAVSASAEDVYYISEGGAIAQDAASASAEDAAEYAAYAPYGLSCDAAGKLYYLGAPVRAFEDAFSVDSGTAELSYFDASGAVDVRAKRDAQGALTGLEALSEAEFNARDLHKWTDPEPVRIESTATDGNEPTPEERAAFFAPYEPFGLRYDAALDALYFNGRPVRKFLDVRSSNGESPTSGKFQGSLTQLQFDGEVDVTTLRDYSHPDANGEGKLIGIEATEAN